MIKSKDYLTLFILILSLHSLQERSVCADPVPKKWFPGHYVYHQADDYSASNADLTFLGSADGALFKGMFMYVTWGQIETTDGVTPRWDKIDGILNALPEGKKLAVSLSWQAWSKLQACPADMIDNPLYDGGQHLNSNGYPFSTIYMTSTMDRYLAFVRKFAERYDSDPRLALVTTAEIPFYDPSSGIRGPLFNEATARANYYRLPNEMIGYFPNTPCGILGAWWSFGDWSVAPKKFTDDTYNAGGGFGFPDLLAVNASHYNSDFRSYVLARAGKWASWMGVEWMDLMPQYAGSPFPDAQIASANLTKTNFIWWLRTSRVSEGGYSFTSQALPYLKANPGAGITTACPLNMTCAGISSENKIEEEFKGRFYPNPVKDILQIDPGLVKATITIINIYGNIVLQRKGVDSEISIYVGELSPGIYFLKFENKDKPVVRKLVKE